MQWRDVVSVAGMTKCCQSLPKSKSKFLLVKNLTLWFFKVKFLKSQHRCTLNVQIMGIFSFPNSHRVEKAGWVDRIISTSIHHLTCCQSLPKSKSKFLLVKSLTLWFFKVKLLKSQHRCILNAQIVWIFSFRISRRVEKSSWVDGIISTSIHHLTSCPFMYSIHKVLR